MNIVGVYKEIQDQHMNIVSFEIIFNYFRVLSNFFLKLFHSRHVSSTVESFLCRFIGAIRNKLRKRYKSCAIWAEKVSATT